MKRMIVGCMTGTSIDGLDCALVEISGNGLEISAHLAEFIERPLGDLRAGLRRLADQVPMPAGEIAGLSHAFGELHAEVVAQLLRGRRVDLIAVHGQTVFHSPPVSWQMVNPWPIAARFGVPVVSDLRGADLASGGQGAPITPLADWVLFRGEGERAIVNLGGFCNVTLLPVASTGIMGIRGFDVCACNHVMDMAAQRGLGRAFDEDGAAALRGSPKGVAVEELCNALARQAGAGRSLGTGDESREWVERWGRTLAGDDLVASAAEGVARAIAARLPAGAEAVVAGGGARNAALMRSLEAALGRSIRCTDELGMPMQAREAACIAVLGTLAMDRVPITLEAVTDRRHDAPIAGAWIFPGDGVG